MIVLTFNTISTWKCGKEKIDFLLQWCRDHCEDRVNHIILPANNKRVDGPGQAFAFDSESDVLLFTLAWR